MKRKNRTDDEKRAIIAQIKQNVAGGSVLSREIKAAGIVSGQYYKWQRGLAMTKKPSTRGPYKKKTQLLELPMLPETSAHSENVAMIICRTPDIRSVLENVFGGRI